METYKENALSAKRKRFASSCRLVTALRLREKKQFPLLQSRKDIKGQIHGEDALSLDTGVVGEGFEAVGVVPEIESLLKRFDVEPRLDCGVVGA